MILLSGMYKYGKMYLILLSGMYKYACISRLGQLSDSYFEHVTFINRPTVRLKTATSVLYRSLVCVF